jgi:hypothetical protein
MVGGLLVLNEQHMMLHAQPVIQLDSVEVAARKSRMSGQSLYTYNTEETDPNIRGFRALDVYKAGMSSEIWSSNTPCLRVSPLSDPDGSAGLALKWDKLAEGCPAWIGLGMGWDAWAPKNMEQVIHYAALNIRLKTLEGQPKNIPVAFALEDYSGAQCWLGFQSKYLVKPGLSNAEWNELRLPLEDFEWERSQAQPVQIKQLIIQFEARGNMAIDEISWVPHSGNPPHAWMGLWINGRGSHPVTADREVNFLVGKNGQELLLFSPFDTLPAGTFTLSALPERAKIRRAGKLSDFVFQSETSFAKRSVTTAEDGVAPGLRCLRISLPQERHPGILKNQPYYLSFRADAQKTSHYLLWGSILNQDHAH